MNQKLLVRVLLGVLALLLVAGMVVQFTPALNGLGGNANAGTPALKVNGKTVTAEELERVRQSNPVLSMARDGVLGEDFKTVIVDQKVREVLLSEAAKDVKISRQEVNEQVQRIRAQNNLTKNKDYVEALQRNGLTDATFRETLRERLAIEKKVKEIQDAAPKATEEEARLHYTLNKESYRSEPRIAARAIAVKDEQKAKDLLAQIKGGADFAKLASEHSLENKDRGGALGTVDNGKIRPVGRTALPAEVNEAAFKLTEGGVTDVVKSGDKFYIVKVEQFVPAGVKPFEEVKSQVMKAVADQKKNAAVEDWLAKLESQAKVEVLDKNWEYYNPVVATVADQNVRYSEVLNAMLGNPQFGQFIQQGGDQAAMLVNGFFKPQVLGTIIDSYAAEKIVDKLKLPLAGNRQELLAGLQAYGTRDVNVTRNEIQQAYEQQKEQFATPASANVVEATFKDRAKALAFRDQFAKNGQDFTAAASKAGGTVAERGNVTAGDGKLNPISEKSIFESGRLTPAAEGSVSDVIEVGGRYSVLFVKDLVKATTRPLSEVEGELREQVLAQKRSAEGQQFVKSHLKDVKVENKLDSVIKAVEKRAAQKAPKTPAKPGADSEDNTKGPADAGATPTDQTPGDSESDGQSQDR